MSIRGATIAAVTAMLSESLESGARAAASRTSSPFKAALTPTKKNKLEKRRKKRDAAKKSRKAQRRK